MAGQGGRTGETTAVSGINLVTSFVCVCVRCVLYFGVLGPGRSFFVRRTGCMVHTMALPGSRLQRAREITALSVIKARSESRAGSQELESSF
jgi:hypothetical protein